MDAFGTVKMWSRFKNFEKILTQFFIHRAALDLMAVLWATAAAAKLLQSCPTLCDPIDGSPPGSAVPGILQRPCVPRQVTERLCFSVKYSYNKWSSPQEEKAMAPHSSTLAWKIPWMEEPGGLQSMGSQRVGHD